MQYEIQGREARGWEQALWRAQTGETGHRNSYTVLAIVLYAEALIRLGSALPNNRCGTSSLHAACIV